MVKENMYGKMANIMKDNLRMVFVMEWEGGIFLQKPFMKDNSKEILSMAMVNNHFKMATIMKVNILKESELQGLLQKVLLVKRFKLGIKASLKKVLKMLHNQNIELKVKNHFKRSQFKTKILIISRNLKTVEGKNKNNKLTALLKTFLKIQKLKRKIKQQEAQ